MPEKPLLMLWLPMDCCWSIYLKGLLYCLCDTQPCLICVFMCVCIGGGGVSERYTHRDSE